MDSKHSGLGFCSNCTDLLLWPLKKLLGFGESFDLSPLGQGDTNSNYSDIQEPSPSSHLSQSVQGIIDGNCSNSIQRICKYDVFISFRGPDTRQNFTDHLYNQLIARGISTFMDDKELEKGQPISSQLLQAIKDSRVSIVVFSESYATSTWCLEEMATIVDCRKDLKQIVFPIFYDMDPSDVRKQSGVYEKAFASHTKKYEEDLVKVDRWKSAMVDLANLVGWDVRDMSEFNEIGKIVHTVIKALGHKFSRLVDDLVGIQPRVDGLENLLKLSSEDGGFRVLGIWGMGGIGKTTLVTALYDKISYQFDACSFIDTSQLYKNGGVSAIHKQILRQALHEQNLDTYSPYEISGIVSNMLVNRKVLVVLDNVDELWQLEKLAIDPRFLCAGSRIIITTRDEHILKVYGADSIYNVPLLNNMDAYLLFHRKAFKCDYPKIEFLELIPEVLKYTEGLPLAIRVIGSFLCTRNATQWRNALDKLKSNPNHEIIDVLRISFDGLDPEEKEIFLHIACFFKGEREDYVMRILDGIGLHPYIGIPIIIEKSLISITNNEIHMHEMIQELGIKIVREESPKAPGSWSRLWLYNDFLNVLKLKLGTNNTQAIVLDRVMDMSMYELLEVEELSKMKSLKLLILHLPKFSGSLDFLSNELQWLSWQGYPFPSLPSKFESYKLVELNMCHSKIKQLWEGKKYFPCLKRMDLSRSGELMETPDFERTLNIERLDLTGCTSLSKIHPSIGLLKELTFLSLRNCTSLVSLELGSVSNLSSLRVLYLSGCTRLNTTPDFRGLTNLEYLDLERCIRLTTIHNSIGVLVKLKFLSLRYCFKLVRIPYSINFMTSLTTLDLKECCKLQKFPPGRRSELRPSYLRHWRNQGEIPDPLGQRSDLGESVHISTSRYIPSSYLGSMDFLDLSRRNQGEIPNPLGQRSELRSSYLGPRHNQGEIPDPLGQRSELGESVHVSTSRYTPSSFLGSMIFLDLSRCNLRKITDAIGELRCLERLNLMQNNFDSLPDTLGGLFSLAYLNLSHCHMLQRIPSLPSTNASSVGRYFGTISGSYNHRSGLYIFDCPKLVESEVIGLRCSELALAWLTRLVEEPRHFRCGFDIVVLGSVIPELFSHQYEGGSVIRIEHSEVDDNWIGFAFCVAFEHSDNAMLFKEDKLQSDFDMLFNKEMKYDYPYIFRQDKLKPSCPLYLSFESEHTEESFDMPLSNQLESYDGSKHLWIIYMSRPHCHFVKTGAHITFKARPGLKVWSWGLRMLFKQDILAMKRNLNNDKEPLSKLQITGEDNQLGEHTQVDRFHFDYVHDNQRWSSWPEKIKLPYNWLVTEKEEIENMSAKAKENDLSFIGLGQPLS